MIGERLDPVIRRMHGDLAGKITGMLLELDNAELLAMSDNRNLLITRVEEAVEVLKAYRPKVHTM